MSRSRVTGAMDRLLALGGSDPERVWLGGAGARQHVLVQGSGDPVLLLHGGGGGGANWYRVLGALAAEYRVLAPDLPGFGLSDPVQPSVPLGTQAARLVATLLDELGIARVSVLGTSFGGLAALRLAQHFPERVSRLMLLDTAGLAAGLPLAVRAAVLPLIAPLALRPSRRGTQHLLRTLLTSTRLEPAHEAALVEYLHAVACLHGESFPAALRAFAGWRGQREWCGAADLSAVRAPTLLLWGARDRFFPVAQAQAAAPRFASATLSVLADAGHSPNWECPAEVLNRVRRFLAANHI